MSTIRRIAKNTTVLLVAQVASYLLAFFYMMYTARYLGAAGFGILSFALAFTGIFGVFGDLGLRPLTVREVARDKSLAQKYLANVSLMKIILVAVTFGLIALTINLMGYPEQTIKVVYLLALFVIFQAFTQMFYSVFQAFERMEFQAIGQMLNAALILSGVIFAIKYGFTVVGFASLYVIASIIVLGYTFAVTKLKFSNPSLVGVSMAFPVPRREINYEFMKVTVRKALPLAIGGVFVLIYFWIDRVMLSIMKGDAVVGYYSAAYNLINAISLIPAAFALALFPVMSNYFKTSSSSLNMLYQHSAKYMYMLALPLTVGTILLSKRVIFIIYGGGFLPSVQALNVLIVAGFFVFVDMVLGYMLLSIDKERVNMFNAGVGAALNVALNLLLIPRFSLIGAAIATVITEFYFFIAATYALSKAQYKLDFAKIIVKPLLATLVMGGFIYHFSQATLFMLIPASAVIYFLILYVTKYISTEDIALVKQTLRTK